MRSALARLRMVAASGLSWFETPITAPAGGDRLLTMRV
jgi:hypothetical protein